MKLKNIQFPDEVRAKRRVSLIEMLTFLIVLFLGIFIVFLEKDNIQIRTRKNKNHVNQEVAKKLEKEGLFKKRLPLSG